VTNDRRTAVYLRNRKELTPKQRRRVRQKRYRRSEMDRR
jgi:hypothetical protein